MYNPAMVKHLAFTFYQVKDMPRARKFYEGGLGLKSTKDFRGEWVEYHVAGGCFALTTMATGSKPGSAGNVAFEVADVDKTVAALRRKKVTVKVPAFSTPVCRMAVVSDPDGNGVGIHAKKG